MSTYIEKNRGFLTSSKLKEFRRCQQCYYWQYEEEIPLPFPKTHDYFVVGQALDDLVTHGVQYYIENYEVVARRSKSAKKTQLTKSTGQLIDHLHAEYGYQSKSGYFPLMLNKKVIEYEFSGVKLRGEMDGYDNEGRLIQDLKTCASLLTFDPFRYTFQMSFYQWLVEETEDIRCIAELYVIDKNLPPRSRGYRFSESTLLGERGRILEAIEDYKLARDSGIWESPRDEEEQMRCPYWGFRGHNRPKNFTVI